MKEKRGRPIEYTQETKPKKWEVLFKEEDGTETLVKWDLNIRPDGNMISSEIIKEGNKETIEDKPIEKFGCPPDNDKLPKSKRKYLNEKTGKWVAYFRARELGIVD